MFSLQCQLFLIANLTRIIPCQRVLEDWTLLNLLQTRLIVLSYVGLSAKYLRVENNSSYRRVLIIQQTSSVNDYLGKYNEMKINIKSSNNLI